MDNTNTKNKLIPNSITITYLSKVSFASLNGSDKDVDNINPIKKVTLDNGHELPYVSSQAIRRALRDQLKEMKWELSPIVQASVTKGAPKTETNPAQYIDDDLFGYMDAKAGDDGEKGSSTTRTSPIRVESLLALSEYKGDLDFATNFMGKGYQDDKGKDIQPNIFETEIHSGIYKGTILIELDRIGEGQGFEKTPLDDQKKKERLKAFIAAFQNLWSSGRQSRFLADISPKFIAAAYMKVKNPIFLEAVNIKENKVTITALNSVIADYEDFIEKSIFAEQKAIFNSGDNVKSLKEGFNEISGWIDDYYKKD
ncbi:MAG: type I-B CRISPR-associated protein Cas7/Cst2/DevR [Spirochaetes bacterium]|nr:type I-B CRISPR-associated protein Cas7/Cst2/DevR [Spirochaetota bacterium]